MEVNKSIGDGGAAFPVAMSQQTASNQDCAPFQAGMTLHDWFAGQALAGLTADHELSIAQAIDMAWEAADGMIVSRQQPAKKG